MKRLSILLISCCISGQFLLAQDYGSLPKIEKGKLLNDLDLLQQALDEFHSGMYWYTPKDSVDKAFEATKRQITTDLNVLEFHKLIGPLVALSREDHTDISRPKIVGEALNTEIKLFPLKVVFLGEDLYCVKNGADFRAFAIEGKEIESINGESPTHIVGKIGSLFASDGFIKTSKYSDLEGFNFAIYYFFYFGQIEEFKIKLKDIEEPLIVEPLTIPAIRNNLKARYPTAKSADTKEVLQYKILNDSVAYLGVHTFDNGDIKEFSKDKKFSEFLRKSFKSIEENNIEILVVDLSNNSGGSEGNEGLLYSYFGENYQKYLKVRTKSQKVILNNGSDPPIKLKAYGFLERVLTTKKVPDGSLERRALIGKGLMAFKKEPDYKYAGKTYVLISGVTYSGGSEFSNMMYTKDLATFVGQETGGGYLGNTSGYSGELVLPHSKITVSIPALQFMMNVEPKLPFGSGVLPHYEVIPSFEDYVNGENASLKFILEELLSAY